MQQLKDADVLFMLRTKSRSKSREDANTVAPVVSMTNFVPKLLKHMKVLIGDVQDIHQKGSGCYWSGV